jgi:hypothetical protein
MHTTIYKEVEVDVDLSDFDTDDLIEELESRGLDYNTNGVDGNDMRALLTQIWIYRREGRDYQRELDQMIWYGIGKLV